MGGWRGTFSLSPASVLLLTLLFVILMQGVAFLYLTNQPWTGLRLEPDSNLSFLRVASVVDNSPASAKFQPGQVLNAIGLSSEVQPLLPLLVIDPKEIATHKQHTSFMEAQREIHLKGGLPSSPLIKIWASDGGVIEIRPYEKIPVWAIPALFWVASFVGLIALLIGVFIWSCLPFRSESNFLLLSGCGYYLYSLAYGMLNSRDLFMPAEVINGWASVQALGQHVFVFCLFAVLVFFPNQLFSRKFLVYIGLLNILLLLNYHFKVIELPGHIFFAQFFPYLLITIVFIWVQWLFSKNQPVNRAAILAIQAPMVVVGVLVIRANLSS